MTLRLLPHRPQPTITAPNNSSSRAGATSAARRIPTSVIPSRGDERSETPPCRGILASARTQFCRCARKRHRESSRPKYQPLRGFTGGNGGGRKPQKEQGYLPCLRPIPHHCASGCGRTQRCLDFARHDSSFGREEELRERRSGGRHSPPWGITRSTKPQCAPGRFGSIEARPHIRGVIPNPDEEMGSIDHPTS